MLACDAFVELGSSFYDFFHQMVSSSLFQDAQQNEWGLWLENNLYVFNEELCNLIAIKLDEIRLNQEQWLEDFASICVRYDAFLESVRLKGLFGYFEEVLQDHCNKGLVQGMMVCFMKISTFLHGFFQSYNQFAFDWILHNRIQVIFVFQELDNRLIQFLPDFFFSLFLRFLATCVQNLGLVFT
jgi:hypothetical protein